MNWNQPHHWFWHFPYQFCSITIFTRMPLYTLTIPGTIGVYFGGITNDRFWNLTILWSTISWQHPQPENILTMSPSRGVFKGKVPKTLESSLACLKIMFYIRQRIFVSYNQYIERNAQKKSPLKLLPIKGGLILANILVWLIGHNFYGPGPFLGSKEC